MTNRSERRLQERRRTSEGCFSEAVDRRREVHVSPCRGIAEHPKETGDAESAFRSDTARGLFVEENEVGLDGLSQDDRRALACLQFFQAAGDNLSRRWQWRSKQAGLTPNFERRRARLDEVVRRLQLLD